MKKNLVRKVRYIYFKTSVLMLFFGALGLPGIRFFEHTGDNMFDVYLNGALVGQVADAEEAENCMTRARYAVSEQSDELVFMKTELALEGREVLFGEISREESPQ